LLYNVIQRDLSFLGGFCLVNLIIPKKIGLFYFYPTTILHRDVIMTELISLICCRFKNTDLTPNASSLEYITTVSYILKQP